MKYAWISLLLLLSNSVIADTLYQANVGGYSTSVGVGLGGGAGFSVGGAYAPYSTTVNPYSGYTAPGAGVSGVPYDNFTYPYGSTCCGCNQCNNCDTGYGDLRR